MAFTEQVCVNFQGQVLRNLSETLVIENFIFKCQAKLVFSSQSPLLAKKLLSKHRAILTYRKLEAFLDAIDSNLKDLDVHLLCEELLRQFVAANIDFCSIKVLIENLECVREGLILMKLARILMVVLQYRFKNKNIACKIFSKMIKRLTNFTGTNLNKETIQTNSFKSSANHLNGSQSTETQKLRLFSANNQYQREIFNRDEFTKYSKNFPHSKLLNLQPLDIFDKISLEEREFIFCDSDSIEMEDIINEL